MWRFPLSARAAQPGRGSVSHARSPWCEACAATRHRPLPRKSWQAQKCSPQAHLRRTSASYATAQVPPFLKTLPRPSPKEVGAEVCRTQQAPPDVDLARRWVRAFACSICSDRCHRGPRPSPGGCAGIEPAGLLTFARAQNPELKAMRREADAAAQRVKVLPALPDPVLRVELADINNYGSRTCRPGLLPWKVSETKYTLMQALPLWGSATSSATRRAPTRARPMPEPTPPGPNSRRASGDLCRKYYRAAGNERLSPSPGADGAPGTGVADPICRWRTEQSDAIRAQLEQTAMRAELIALDGEAANPRPAQCIARSRQRRALARTARPGRPVPPVTVGGRCVTG